MLNYHDLPTICPNFFMAGRPMAAIFTSPAPSLLGPTPRPSRISRVMARLTTSREARPVTSIPRRFRKKTGIYHEKNGFDHEKCLIWWFDHEEIGNLTMKTGEVMNRLDWHMKKCSPLSHKNSKRTRTKITIYNHLSEMIEEQWPFTFPVSCQSELTQQISKKNKWDILFGYSIYW